MFTRVAGNTLMLSAMGVMFVAGCSNNASVPDVRRVAQKLSIVADCSHFQLYSQLNGSLPSSVEKGFSEQCTSEDVTQVNDFLKTAKAQCTGTTPFQGTINLTRACAGFLDGVIADLKAKAAGPAGTGAITINDLAALAVKATALASCFGVPEFLSALSQSVDEDDLAAINEACTRADYDIVSLFSDEALNVCTTVSLAAAKALLANVESTPVGSISPDCLNLIQRTLGR